jgi:hypothetical protein
MMFRFIKVRLYIIVVFCTTGLLLSGCTTSPKPDSESYSEDVYDIADKLKIIPTPRELVLTEENIFLDDWEIVCTRETEGFYTVGAEEINNRITSLGGNKLPVVSFPSHDKKGSIIIGSWPDILLQEVVSSLGVRLSLSEPGEQGYIIEYGKFRNLPVILIGGSDPQGALYGCVTFRNLLNKYDNKIVAHSGKVRDWPDFKIRTNAKLFFNTLSSSKNTEDLNNVAEELKGEIDFYLRHKINSVYVRGWEGLATANPDRKGGLFKNRYQKAMEVLDYARERGIKTRFTGVVEISRYLTPEQRKGAIVKAKKPGSAYIWSAFDAHGKKAHNYAQFLKEAKATLFVLHCIDVGPYTDPQDWNHRHPWDRERYKDDERTRADYEVFKLYFDIIRKECPQIEFAAVGKPYHFSWILPSFATDYEKIGEGLPSNERVRDIKDSHHARKLQQEHVEYYRELSRKFPRDLAFTFREAGRETFLGLLETVNPHPIDIWIYPERTKGWKGTFCPQVRMAKTFWIPNRVDGYFVAGSWVDLLIDSRVQRLAQQEYLWNTNRPDGSDEFTIWSRYYKNEGREVTDFQQKHLIPRICKILYGEQATPAFQKLVEENVSFSYVSSPEEISGYGHDAEKFDNTYQYMEEQAAKFQDIYNEFQRLFEIIEDHPGQGIDLRTKFWIAHFYKYSGICAQKAKLEIMADSCKKLMEQKSGTTANQAINIAENILVELPELQANFETIIKKSEEVKNKFGSMPISFVPLQGDSEKFRGLNEFSPLDYKTKFEKIAKSGD